MRTTSPTHVSVVADLRARLAALDERLGRRAQRPHEVAETAHLLAETVEDAADGRTPEIELRYGDLACARAEALVAGTTRRDRVALAAWRPLARPSRRAAPVPVRVRAEGSMPLRCVPSSSRSTWRRRQRENMFFESYGADSPSNS
ncbi:MAG: hypothetical protein R3F34_11070 [Planctomycetota bacterium]